MPGVIRLDEGRTDDRVVYIGGDEVEQLVAPGWIVRGLGNLAAKLGRHDRKRRSSCRHRLPHLLHGLGMRPGRTVEDGGAGVALRAIGAEFVQLRHRRVHPAQTPHEIVQQGLRCRARLGLRGFDELIVLREDLLNGIIQVAAQLQLGLDGLVLSTERNEGQDDEEMEPGEDDRRDRQPSPGGCVLFLACGEELHAQIVGHGTASS